MSNLLEFLVPDPKQRAAEGARAKLRVDVTERLLIEMEEAKISKADLAKMVGVSRSAVTQALSGSRNMTLNAVADFALALGHEASFVLTRRPEVASVQIVGLGSPIQVGSIEPQIATAPFESPIYDTSKVAYLQVAAASSGGGQNQELGLQK